jgi:hypothetical protein
VELLDQERLASERRWDALAGSELCSRESHEIANIELTH